MSRLWMAAALAFVIMGITPAPAGEPAEARLQAARAAIKDMAEKLKAQLMGAINEGGPLAAIAVCKTVAPTLAEEASQAHGMRVSRTALKIRNPANAPDAFERRVLEDFLARAAAGEDVAKLEHAESVSENGKAAFRFMKAIPTAAEPCLACHGGAIEPGLKAEIDRLYPQDEATGFKAGDLRGAFSVRMDVP